MESKNCRAHSIVFFSLGRISRKESNTCPSTMKSKQSRPDELGGLDSDIELVDFTGNELHPGKRGKIAACAPKALTKLGLNKNHWTNRVKGTDDPNDKLSAYLPFRCIGFLSRLGLLACSWRIGRVDRQSQENQPARAVWHWLCTDFEQDLSRHWGIFYAAPAAGCVCF